ncbi:hypothetical protein DC28_12340 [Spirochaeta lutea]|uniref:Uncharacterized protein n=1 Tax=Spirochaeta lutea TaxID=1480694 RepID=A0A098QUI2_9SPIO|nr:hypothetical protein DC28_12340 [Spirochaeta lutea]
MKCLANSTFRDYSGWQAGYPPYIGAQKGRLAGRPPRFPRIGEKSPVLLPQKQNNLYDICIG